LRKTKFENWRDRQKEKKGLTELTSISDLLRLMLDGKRARDDRKINPTQLEYCLSDSKLKAYMGPAGCAKTSTGCADIMLRALLMPGTKWFVARRDYNDLIDTTMRSMQNILSQLPEGTLLDRQKMAPQKWWIRPIVHGMNGAATAPSEITFMGLSDYVGSYEFTGGFVDEADEVEAGNFMQMVGRLRHKPTPDFPDENFFIGCAFNPPSMTHWLYTECTGLNVAGEKVKEPSMSLFRPQPAENQRNLPKGYYEQMAASMNEELRQRYVEGKWGNTYPGEPVIRQFRRATHVRQGLTHQGGTLFRFWDFGYNRPAVLFAQIATDGRMQVLREFLGHHIEGTKFIETVLAQTAQHFPEAEKFVDYGDPAVAQHKDTGSMLALLFNAGILMRYQRTPFDLSLQCLRKRFETLVEGEPAMLIDESCRVLIDGLAGGYHLKEDGVTPRKDGHFDHECDALRYGNWNIFGVASSAMSVGTIPSSLASTRR
jgi:Phage terminase large subunit